MSEQPLQGAQLDAFRKTAANAAKRASENDAGAGTQLPALYLAGFVEARADISPDGIGAAVNARRPFLEAQFEASGTAEQKIALMEKTLKEAYAQAQKAPPTGGSKREVGPFASLTYDKSKALPVTAEQQDYFVRMTLQKASQSGFGEYKADMAMMAGELDAAGGITEKKIEEMVWSRPHLHPEPDYRALTDVMIASLTAARGFVPKVKEQPSAEVRPQHGTAIEGDALSIFTGKVDYRLRSISQVYEYSNAQMQSISRIVDRIVQAIGNKITDESFGAALIQVEKGLLPGQSSDYEIAKRVVSTAYNGTKVRLSEHEEMKARSRSR